MNAAYDHGCEGYVPPSLLLQWHITNRCNLRCTHCYQETYQGEELDLPELLQILEQYEILLQKWRRSRPGRRIKGHITVTGGEPFVHRNFPELLHEFALRRASFSFGILTNGVLIKEDTAAFLAEVAPAFVQVSIDGPREVHDRIRGHGHFDQAVEGLQHMIGAGIRTFISFTAHRGNFHQFPEVARLGHKLGVSRVWTDRMIPSGAGKTLDDQPMTPAETREYCALIQRARDEVGRKWGNRTEIAAHRALQFLTANDHAYHCTAGDSLITVMPNGDVYPCRRMPLKVGNVFQTSLLGIYATSPLLRALRDPANNAPECGACTFHNQCRGGLKCLSFAVYGDPFQADPGCWITSKTAPLGVGPAANNSSDALQHRGDAK
jgi:radical SAM protein with 4Fe4S-binding SPASM domain